MGSPSTDQKRSSVNEKKGSKIIKHKWTRKEDLALVAALLELRGEGWIKDNGAFKSGYLFTLEELLKSSLPGSDLKATPHIESRLKMFKRQHDAITEIIQAAGGIEWDSEQNMVICEDDGVWEEWVQGHPYARGLRNIQTPYYDDLILVFGNRGKRIRVDNNTNRDRAPVSEEEHMDAILNQMGGERSDEYDIGNCHIYEPEPIDSFDRELDHHSAQIVETDGGADASNDREMSRGTMLVGVIAHSDQEQLRDDGEAPTGADGSTDANVLLDAIDRIGRQTDRSAPPKLASRKRWCCGGNKTSELREVINVIGTCLQKSEKQSSLLVDILGRQAALDKAAAERREKLNGELSKLPNLNLQSRLRAASIIVGEPAKLDLFYSLPNNERREWVSMVLSGLI